MSDKDFVSNYLDDFSSLLKSNENLVNKLIEVKEILLDVKKNKSNTIGYACIIDRSGDKILIKDKIISQIKLHIPTFEESSIPAELKKIKPTKPGSGNISK